MTADSVTLFDRGESIFLMEPMKISQGSRYQSDLNDLALELVKRAAHFKASLPNGVLCAVSDLVRSMNCYYSNLIEGHDTHPIDIERALNNDYSNNAENRNLQLEAKAHVVVQQWIDEGGLRDRAVSMDGIIAIHQRFATSLPAELLKAIHPDTGEIVEVKPGKLRQRDVRVGGHIAISPGAVERFLKHFEKTYGASGELESIVSTAAAHHRLLWIHPFLDGNGRVARLMSHAMLLEKLETGGVWSIARGLARNIDAYKGYLAACDQSRHNDHDGRGNLSEKSLADFTAFFLETCIDQVQFMEDLVQSDRLRNRILAWAEEESGLSNLSNKAGRILEAILFRGELPRGDVQNILDTGDRQARRIVSDLIGRGVVVSDGMRAPLRIAFPAKNAARWMPGLFPDQPSKINQRRKRSWDDGTDI
jgi:Fic family protein